jgi:hypothetical protein
MGRRPLANFKGTLLLARKTRVAAKHEPGFCFQVGRAAL